MTKIEIFENLVEPLRAELGERSYSFLLRRGERFIKQMDEINQTEKEKHAKSFADFCVKRAVGMKWGDGLTTDTLYWMYNQKTKPDEKIN